MSAQKKVYLAGPAVFRPDAAAIGRTLKGLCSSAGLEGLWPGATTDGAVDIPAASPFHAARLLFEANVAMIAASDAVIADVAPFRGPSCDVGTAWEIGFATAIGKPVFGYWPAHVQTGNRGWMRGELINRIFCEQTPTGWRDVHGDAVEDFGLFDNLMLAFAVRPQISGTAEQAIARAASFLGGQEAP